MSISLAASSAELTYAAISESQRGFSLMGYFYMPSGASASERGLMGLDGDNYILMDVDATGDITCWINGIGETDSGVNVIDDEWFYYAFTTDAAGDANFYIWQDGDSAFTATNCGTIAAGTWNDFLIGNTAFGDFGQCHVYNVKMFDVELSESEIQTEMANEATQLGSNVLDRFRLNNDTDLTSVEGDLTVLGSGGTLADGVAVPSPLFGGTPAGISLLPSFRRPVNTLLRI